MKTRNIIVSFAAVLFAASVIACSPEVGSKEWCADMKEKDKGQWTAEEVKDFAKHCIL